MHALRQESIIASKLKGIVHLSNSILQLISNCGDEFLAKFIFMSVHVYGGQGTVPLMVAIFRLIMMVICALVNVNLCIVTFEEGDVK